MVRKIFLTKDKLALVDDEDYEKVLSYKTWRADGTGSKLHPYVAAHSGPRTEKTIYMHEVILNFPTYYISHINGNKLDNRRENLKRRGDTAIKIPSDLILSYFAGLVDGEGCISTQNKRIPRLLLQVSNIYPAVLIEMKEIFGGSFRKTESRNSKSRPIYTWIASGITAGRTLEWILPYLRIKKTQGELGLELFKIQGHPNEENYSKRRELADQIKIDKWLSFDLAQGFDY